MKKLVLILMTVSLLFAMGACDKSANSEGTGVLVIKVTDAPFDISNIESATVTITKVEIREMDSSDENPFVVLSEDTATIDLMDLRNGLTHGLTRLEIPAGDYDLVRLYIEEAGLKLKDVDEPYVVKVPSGNQTGIKIFMDPAITVAGRLTTELLLDFNLSESFVLRGNPDHNNGFIFKPCIRASNLTTAGRVQGMVKDTADMKVANAKVWVSQDTVIATSFSDTTGFYALIGLPAGAYSLFATKEGYDTVKYEGINIIAGNRTVKDFILTKK